MTWDHNLLVAAEVDVVGRMSPHGLKAEEGCQAAGRAG